ncbi:MAG: ATP-binding protein, partial [Actinobacteria bacterium]|nr:ATP-binding protein [Actinomycetota bacterium]
MPVESRIGSGSPEPWYRIHALSADSAGGTAAADYAAVLPAALHAARCRRRFIVGWLSRGGSAPLELITNAGPLPAAHAGPLPAADPGPLPDGSAGTVTAAVDMLFPWGARGTVISDDVLAQLNELVWSPCPGRRVAAAVSVAGGDKAAQQSGPADGRTPPTLFESALQALVGRAFGWLVVAEPTDRLQAETAQLRNELTVLRRYDDEQSRFEASRTEQRLAELDTFGEAGLWDVRVLVGAANEQELELIVPLLVG